MVDFKKKTEELRIKKRKTQKALESVQSKVRDAEIKESYPDEVFISCERPVRGGHIEMHRTHIEICNWKSNLKPTEECAGCRKWEEFIPEGAIFPCPKCEAILVITRAKKCPLCKHVFEEKP